MCQLKVGSAAAKEMGTFEYTAILSWVGASGNKGQKQVTVELPVTHTDAQLIRKVKKALNITGWRTKNHYDEDTIRLVYNPGHGIVETTVIYLFASDVPQA